MKAPKKAISNEISAVKRERKLSVKIIETEKMKYVEEISSEISENEENDVSAEMTKEAKISK